MKLVTIGGYGFDEFRFFAALKNAGVDTFADLRQRRGLRGSRYAFLNSSRLQAGLAEHGIRYVHIRELAPPTDIRDLQKQTDTSAGVAKKARSQLAPAFISAYTERILDHYDASTFRNVVGDSASVVALFCVEGPPDACHRSLVAKFLAERLGCDVQHVVP